MYDVTERFLRYAKVYTTSDEDSSTCPSTKRQLDLAEILVQEMKDLGIEDGRRDENGYVTGTFKGNAKGPVIGFIAHMDTAPDAPGENVNPRIVRNYGGEDIVLDEERDTVLSPKDFPELNSYRGQDIIVTDGRTLLGADDKSGIAEILSALKYLKDHPEIPRVTIKAAFTPDEEIGRGADLFDVKAFGADFAYTVDGGAIGELEYENFNAASAKVAITGRNVHPGTAKDQMINSITAAMRFQDLLPSSQVPEKTEGHQGFIHLHKIEGAVEETALDYIIRDHDKKLFQDKKDAMKRALEQLKEEFNVKATLDIKDQYYNMKEKLKDHMDVVELAKKAMEEVGITPVIQPIRGGTDGSRLSYMGLPCPNIFAGGHNFHGKYEYIPIPSMEKAVDTIISIVKLAAK